MGRETDVTDALLYAIEQIKSDNRRFEKAKDITKEVEIIETQEIRNGKTRKTRARNNG